MRKRMAKVIPALDQDRAIFNRLGKGSGVINAPGYLRLERKLTATKVVDFDLLTNAGTQTKTEKRLQITDTFIVTDLGFFLFTVPTGASTALAVLRTFANPTIFNSATESTRLNALYDNSFFTMTKNGIQSIPALDMARFKSVGVAQQGLDVGVTLAYFQDERRNANIGFTKQYSPVVTFQGNDKVELSITLPDSVDLTDTGGTRDNYAVLYFRGFLRQNASFVGQKK